LSGRDLAWVLAVVVIWGYNFVPIRVALDEVPPFALVALRFLLAAVPMAFFVRRPSMPWRLVLAYGLAIGVGQFGLLFLGIALGMPAGLASLVAQTQVFFTIALWAWVSRDRPRAHQVLGTIVAAAGIAVLALARAGSGAQATVVGLLLTVGAAFSWAIGNVIVKRASAGAPGPIDMFALVVWSSLAAPLPLAVISFFAEGGTAPLFAIAHMSLRAWISVLFMTYGATLFGFAAWNGLLDRYPPAVVTPFALLIPVAGLLSARIWLGESLSPLQWLGGAVVLSGLALNVLWTRKKG
jgi:O-acetylserine/cysteine efflux transporter